MRAFENASQFYTSREWRLFRAMLMQERTNEEGLLLCEHCGKPILKPADCIAHHVEEIDGRNLNDAAITLNPGNIMLVHASCHNEIHDRFGGRLKPWQRKAYVVFGPPMGSAGEYVRRAKGKGDLVLDVDALWEALTMDDALAKPTTLNGVIFPVRDLILDKVRVRAGSWQRAWITSSEAYPSARQRLVDRLGGEPIYLDDTEEECLGRLHADPEGRDVKLYEILIRDWFAERRAEMERDRVAG